MKGVTARRLDALRKRGSAGTVNAMTMDTLFLGSFLFGLGMVLASTVLGFAHLALPGAHGGLHLDGHAVHVGHGAPGDGGAHGHGDSGSQNGLPLWNVSSLLAFLMWFGAAGYISTRFIGLHPLWALIPAVGFGVAGGLLVSAFLALVMRGESWLTPGSGNLEGTLARVSVTIPAGGVGEILFEKGERRRGEGARGVEGARVARGEEVVVLAYDRGIAVVQPWQAFIDGERETLPELPLSTTEQNKNGVRNG